MSKIYDALSRGNDEAADIIRKLVGSEPPADEAISGGESGLYQQPQSPNGHPQSAPSTVAEASRHNGFPQSYQSASAIQPAGPSAVTAPEPIRTASLPPFGPIVMLDDSHVRAAEQFRMVRTKIAQHPRKPQAITISSGNPGDGKTFTAMNLAAALALKEDDRVILVEGDLRRSNMARALNLPETPGLTEVLSGTAKLRSALVQVTEIPNLYVLPAGERVSNPVELLDSPAWTHLFKALRANFRFIIVDAPPVAAVTDYDVIQQACDGVVLVVRQDHSNRAAFQHALAAVPVERRLGVVLNSAQQDWLTRQTSGYYYYGNYDSYYYGRGSKNKKK